MTESVVTISPKTSPYRSQIQTRTASPRSLSSVNFYVSPVNNRNIDDDHAVSNEKSQLKKLNDQFLSYIERVRLCETYNNCLTVHCEHIKNAQACTKDKFDSLKQEFQEYQQERFNREKKDVELENDHNNGVEKQVNEYKNRRTFLQHEHELNRQQIIDMQQQSIDIQAKTEKLRFDYENFNDDSNHYRKQVSYYQLFKSSILDEISHQRDMHQRVQSEVDDLNIQKQLSIQAHEADTQAIEIQNDNIFYDLTTQFRLDGNEKSVLKQTLNEIREEYKKKDNEMREELHRKYLNEYNQHKKKLIDQNLIETNRETIERHHLSNELNALKDNRVLLRQKLTLVQEHYKQLEVNVQRELKRQKDMHEQYDHEIKKLSSSVQEYENLLSHNSLALPSTIKDEVNKYRQLLEGSDQQIGLRQIVNRSNKKSESVSTSENFYATAPIQQYLSAYTSRLISETDLKSTNDSTKHDETINEISIDMSHTDVAINQTLPFIPMETRTSITEEQQSPLISTFENREPAEQITNEPNTMMPSEIIIPITIDINSAIDEELNEAKIVMVSPTPVLDQPMAESTIVEVPVSTLPAENPLAKLILTMLPDAAPFVPSSNVTNNQSVTPMPITVMNNDAPAFIPNNQHQHVSNQQHWGGRGGPGGNNRRGQNAGGGFHHGGGGGGGGGNQRSGGGGNWQQSGGGGGGSHPKQRRGQK
ncbi:unnamed protein product [Rotaria socialis]|uniref:Uncharacterized protein n=2 Tax=Rotaria socialis TaxID=392032 RepID=A0A818GGK9_9BILA|nr:unnamed protein product [Rotaria socialis]CAF3489613.1 unnamed protein product [Rotaria socialis]